MITSKIVEIESKKNGPTLAIFAGVHGNERAGIYALEELLPNIKITRGKLMVAFANPPAIEASVRMVNKNLNRCFFKGNKGKSPEDMRARELMKVLDKCDALLDLHMFHGSEGRPFVICEETAVEIARKFDVGVISTNWTKTEPGGTDGYMYLAGKIGICVECGPIGRAEEYKEFAKQTIYQFLKYFDMVAKDVQFSTTKKRIIKAKKAIYKKSENFVIQPGFQNFDSLAPGQVIATEGIKKYKASEGECIIFPHYKARVGEEAYILGEKI